MSGALTNRAVVLPVLAGQFRRFGADRAIWAVADQALFSTANFLLNILLARWLSPEDYGWFALSYSALLLLASLHTSVLVEPMMVFGAGKYAGRLSRYLGLVMYGHWAATGGVSLLLACVGLGLWAVQLTALASVVLTLAIALPLILFYWLIRRFAYVRFRPQWSVGAAALNLPTLLLGAWVLHALNWVTPTSALLLMALVGGLISLLLLRFVRPAGPMDVFRSGSQDSPASGVLRDHWRYAGWSMAANAMIWSGANAQYILLTSTSTLDQVGAMRALDSMLLPYWQYMAAVSTSLVPTVARHVSESGWLSPRYMVWLCAALVGQSVVACALLLAGGGYVFSIIYGANYATYAWLIPLYALVLIPETLATAVLLIYRSLVETRVVFVYHLLLPLGLLLGYLLFANRGVVGLIETRVVVSYALMVGFSAVNLVALGRRCRQPR